MSILDEELAKEYQQTQEIIWGNGLDELEFLIECRYGLGYLKTYLPLIKECERCPEEIEYIYYEAYNLPYAILHHKNIVLKYFTSEMMEYLRGVIIQRSEICDNPIYKEIVKVYGWE